MELEPEPGTSRSLNHRPPPSCGEMDHQQDDADDEEDPGDLRSDRCDTCGTEHACNQADDEKYERVIQQSNTSLFR